MVESALCNERSHAEKQDARLMREMFGAIAPRYDFVTRIFSYGMDGRWKRAGVDGVALHTNARVLDLAAGTGDFRGWCWTACRRRARWPWMLTEPMLRVARERGVVDAVCGDATKLPFADGAFDCVFVGYGLRNFPEPARGASGD